MSMRTREGGGFKERFITGPNNKISKRPNQRLTFLCHATSRTGVNESLFVQVPWYQHKTVIETDDALGFRIHTVLSPEQDRGVLWASKTGQFDDQGRMYNDSKNGKRTYLTPQYDPMIRLQAAVWDGIQRKTIDPDRVIMRIPSHRKFESYDDVERAIREMRDPRDLQNGLDNLKFDDRIWTEWRAGISCGMDVVDKPNMYVQGMRLTPSSWHATVAAVGDELGVIVIPTAVKKQIFIQSNIKMKFFIDIKNLPTDMADQRTDIQAGQKVVYVSYQDKVLDEKTGRMRKASFDEYYNVLIDWDEEAPAELLELAASEQYPDLVEETTPNQSDFDRTYESMCRAVSWARAEDIIDVDQLHEPWKELLEQSRGEDSAKSASPTSSRVVRSGDASEGSTSSSSSSAEVKSKSGGLDFAARSKSSQPSSGSKYDFSIDGRYADVSRRDLFLCDPDPEPDPEYPDEPPLRGCGLFLHPDWTKCPLCGLEYHLDDEEDFAQFKQPPELSELHVRRWPTTESCLSCKFPVSALEDKCGNCDMDQGRDMNIDTGEPQW